MDKKDQESGQKKEKLSGQLGSQETDQNHLDAPKVVEKLVDVWYVREEFAKFKKTIVDYSQLILSLTLIAARYLQLLALVEWYAIEANSLVSLCTLHQSQDNLEDLRYAMAK